MDRRIDPNDPHAVAKLARRAHRLRARYMSLVFRRAFRGIGQAVAAALDFRRELLFTIKRPVHW
jgi:hypothetical protein